MGLPDKGPTGAGATPQWVQHPLQHWTEQDRHVHWEHTAIGSQPGGFCAAGASIPSTVSLTAQ